MSKMKDITGQKFGRLVAVKPIGQDKDKRYLWLCQCECGNTKITISKSLCNGKTQSCGCIHREQLVKRMKKHGLCRTKLYGVWCSMKARCFNKNNKKYKDYGGRGIIMCGEWKNDFETFYNWAKTHGYKDGLSIERINNDGNYEPYNCRWATQYEQGRNQRSNHLITYDGETLCLTDMATKYGINPKILSNRLRYGWGVERALTEPIHKTK